MKLIATDEAGYGPKLGPLVVAATQWDLSSGSTSALDDRFAPLRQTAVVGDVAVVVDDSKAVYQPSGDNPLAGLHAAVSVCNGWLKLQEKGFAHFLKQAAADDADTLQNTPWLQFIHGDPFLTDRATSEALSVWSSSGVACEKLRARVITARAFNHACDGGMNKADLLSESTLGLVRQLMRVGGDDRSFAVYCDRHGGRRYYAGVIQHLFDDATVHVVSESKQQSVYRIQGVDYEAMIHFTVKGDTFTPVAMSSMYAKYIRERMMRSLNEYFAQRHQGRVPLKPTAGYPVDADRFLRDIQPIIQREKIAIEDLVRQR